MTRYSPAEIEARWQAAWEKDAVFKAVRDAAEILEEILSDNRLLPHGRMFAKR